MEMRLALCFVVQEIALASPAPSRKDALSSGSFWTSSTSWGPLMTTSHWSNIATLKILPLNYDITEFSVDKSDCVQCTHLIIPFLQSDLCILMELVCPDERKEWDRRSAHGGDMTKLVQAEESDCWEGGEGHYSHCVY